MQGCYIVDCGDVVKIGSTTRWRGRRRELERDYGACALLAWIETETEQLAQQTERFLHEAFREERVGRTEMFHGSPLLDEIVAMYADDAAAEDEWWATLQEIRSRADARWLAAFNENAVRLREAMEAEIREQVGREAAA